MHPFMRPLNLKRLGPCPVHCAFFFAFRYNSTHHYSSHQVTSVTSGYYRFLQVPSGYYTLLQVTTGYYRFATGYYRLLQVYYRRLQVTSSYKKLIEVTLGYYMLLRVTTGYYWLLQVNTDYYSYYKNSIYSEMEKTYKKAHKQL